MKQLRNSVVRWLVVALLCLLLGFLLGKFKQDVLADQLALMGTTLETTQAENMRLETALSGLQISTVAEQQTIKSLLQNNKLLQDELSIANNKLFFYERVIAPELESSGVKVYSFEVAKNEQTHQWDYQLVLTQSQKNRRFLKGKFTITLSVFEDEKLKLIPLSALTDDLSSSFKFKYFQTIDGSFSLPANTTVDEVIIKLNVAGNRWHKAQSIEERSDWRVLTTTDSGELSEFDNN